MPNPETLGVLIEAGALVIICGLDFAGLCYLIEERREQRQARQEEREERRQAEMARQRADVTCGGVTSILRTLSEEDLCTHLWAGQFRHAGFAFESSLYAQLPEYLRKKSDAFMDEITRAITSEQNKISRRLLVFRFPYPNFNVVLDDVCRLNFGNTYLVWDDNGKPMNVPRN